MKGEVKSVEIKCPKCGYIQMVEEGKKKLNRKLQSAASVRTMEDPESLLPLRQVITKNKEER